MTVIHVGGSHLHYFEDRWVKYGHTTTSVVTEQFSYEKYLGSLKFHSFVGPGNRKIF